MADLPGARHGRAARAVVRQRERQRERQLRRTGPRALPDDTVIIANGQAVPPTEEESDGDRL